MSRSKRAISIALGLALCFVSTVAQCAAQTLPSETPQKFGPMNPTNVDHATDTYDTIDWLVKNIPESNGKVGILGISYDGFLPLIALVNPHPALKVSVPMNPMVDGWMGDDWFHNGAFRQQNLP